MSIIINNHFGEDSADISEKNSGERIGIRIRKIRTAKNLSQGELGQMVGLNADRIQKYENGVRKPKLDLIKQIAGALGVESLALTDPEVSSYFGAMFAFFEMEEHFGLKLEEIDGKMCIYFQEPFPGSALNEYLKKWYKVQRERDEALTYATTDEDRKRIMYEYHMWEWTFPQALADETSKGLKKAHLKSKIQTLQEELKGLDEN